MNIAPTYVLDHLWQSTAFAAVAGLLTLALRTNRARVRQWLWLAASVKFLAPLSLLIALGSQIHWNTAPLRPNVPPAVNQIVHPFAVSADSLLPMAATPPEKSALPEVLFALWAVGVVGLSCAWWVRWRRIRNAVRSGSRVETDLPVRVVCSPTQLEPGIFGVLRPVLLLPEGIFDRLTPAQLRAVLAHELCHVRHRDNLLAAIQMFVETVFWFHPLVWWIGKRMVEERERACDEEVLRTLGEPQAYAEGILNVCRLYVESPLRCMSGITGADLKQRMEAIMKNPVTSPLDLGRKVLLGVMGAAALLLPLFAGFVYGPALRAQISATRPVFTVASVKFHVTPAGGGIDPLGAWPRRSGDRILWHNVPLRLVALYAYRIPAFQLSGNQLQTFDETYDIDAVAEGTPPEDQLRLMFRSLLEDRFGIKVHWETKEMQLYRLLVAKDGSKLKRAEEDSTVMIQGRPIPRGRAAVYGFRDGAHLAGSGASMELLVDALSIALRQPVVDQTGLTGAFDFDMKFQREEDLENTSGNPLIRTALQQTLGLRVEAGKGPVELLVIDHLGKLSEN